MKNILLIALAFITIAYSQNHKTILKKMDDGFTIYKNVDPFMQNATAYTTSNLRVLDDDLRKRGKVHINFIHIHTDELSSQSIGIYHIGHKPMHIIRLRALIDDSLVVFDADHYSIKTEKLFDSYTLMEISSFDINSDFVKLINSGHNIALRIVGRNYSQDIYLSRSHVNNIKFFCSFVDSDIALRY
jgi:hypothetical protein